MTELKCLITWIDESSVKRYHTQCDKKVETKLDEIFNPEMDNT